MAETLQHCSMKDGSGRCGREGLSGPKEGVAAPLWAATAALSGPGRLVAKGTSKGSRGPAGRSALPLLRGGRPGVGRDPGRGSSRLGSPGREDWGLAGCSGCRVATPGHLAGVPATWAGTRLCRPVRTEPGSTPGRLGRPGRREVDC